MKYDVFVKEAEKERKVGVNLTESQALKVLNEQLKLYSDEDFIFKNISDVYSDAVGDLLNAPELLKIWAKETEGI